MSKLLLSVTALAFSVLGATPEEIFKAIRRNDLAGLEKTLAADREAASRADARGTTPLHYAAVIGSDESLRMLLKAGADHKAKNAMDATPLLLAATSPSKAAMLLEAGADPNVKTKSGRTPLMIAAGTRDGLPTLKRLIEAGARLDEVDQFGNTAVSIAAYTGSFSALRVLVEKGANIKIGEKEAQSAILGAMNSGEPERLQYLLSKGADPNAFNTVSGKVRKGDIALKKLTPLLLTATHGTPEMAKVLLDAGANVNAQDERGISPLMAAVTNDRRGIEMVRMLLQAGANVKATDVYGQTATDWARKTGDQEVIQLLQGAGGAAVAEVPAMPVRVAAPNSARQAVEQAVGLLSASAAEFFKESGCVGCHHQPVIARAQAAAKAAGVHLPANYLDVHKASYTAARPLEAMWLQMADTGGEEDTVSQLLVGFAAAGIPAGNFTDIMVNYVANKQRLDGSWDIRGITRPPFEESPFTRTAYAVRALKLYGWPARQAEFDARIAQAREWLMRNEPKHAYEKADRLLGLYWSGAPSSELERAAKALLKEQRPDGGWAQTKSMASDAYATGLALTALHQSGMMKPAASPYQRGVQYLLKTQHEDGSWLVRSRAPKFQPYFESGFPHGHDQWISVAATSYAVMAISPAIAEPAAKSNTKAE